MASACRWSEAAEAPRMNRTLILRQVQGLNSTSDALTWIWLDFLKKRQPRISAFRDTKPALPRANCKHAEASEGWFVICWFARCQAKSVSSTRSPVYLTQLIKDGKIWAVGVQLVACHVCWKNHRKNLWLHDCLIWLSDHLKGQKCLNSLFLEKSQSWIFSPLAVVYTQCEVCGIPQVFCSLSEESFFF